MRENQDWVLVLFTATRGDSCKVLTLLLSLLALPELSFYFNFYFYFFVGKSSSTNSTTRGRVNSISSSVEIPMDFAMTLAPLILCLESVTPSLRTRCRTIASAICPFLSSVIQTSQMYKLLRHSRSRGHQSYSPVTI